MANCKKCGVLITELRLEQWPQKNMERMFLEDGIIEYKVLEPTSYGNQEHGYYCTNCDTLVTIDQNEAQKILQRSVSTFDLLNLTSWRASEIEILRQRNHIWVKDGWQPFGGLVKGQCQECGGPGDIPCGDSYEENYDRGAPYPENGSLCKVCDDKANAEVERSTMEHAPMHEIPDLLKTGLTMLMDKYAGTQVDIDDLKNAIETYIDNMGTQVRLYNWAMQGMKPTGPDVPEPDREALVLNLDYLMPFAKKLPNTGFPAMVLEGAIYTVKRFVTLGELPGMPIDPEDGTDWRDFKKSFHKPKHPDGVTTVCPVCKGNDEMHCNACGGSGVKNP